MTVLSNSLETIETKLIGKFPAVVADSNGVVYPVEFEGDKPTLKEMQDIVGGYIQIITLGNYCEKLRAMVVNEEGKLGQLPLNRRATSIAHGNVAIFDGDDVVGDVLIIEASLLEDDEDEENPEADTTTPPTA